MAFPASPSNNEVYISASGDRWLYNNVHDAWTKRGLVTNQVSASPIESMAIHNLFINGNMEISQENGNTSSNTAGHYPADQTYMYNNFGNCSSWQDTTVPNSNYSKSIVLSQGASSPATNSTSFTEISQYLEGSYFKKLGWGTADAQDLTIGFWARCSSDLIFNSTLPSSSADRIHIEEHNLTGNTWTWINYVIPAQTGGTWYSNTSVGCSFRIYATLGTDYHGSTGWNSSSKYGTANATQFDDLGAGNTFHTTGWVMIPGNHTIAEEDSWKFQLPIDYELRRCKRYWNIYNKDEAVFYDFYQISGGYDTTNFSLQEEMRIVPAITLTWSGAVNFSSNNIDWATTNSFQVILRANNAGRAYIYLQDIITNARL